MAYTDKEIIKIKSKIIDLLSEGDSLKSILDNDGKLPSRATIYQWLNSEHDKYDESFLNNYVRAREDSGDIDAETISEIAKKVLSGDYDPASARVAIDALKWTAGKKKPKKYGDKLEVDNKSSDGSMTPIAGITFTK